jgi:hypothetical protein
MLYMFVSKTGRLTAAFFFGWNSLRGMSMHRHTPISLIVRAHRNHKDRHVFTFDRNNNVHTSYALHHTPDVRRVQLSICKQTYTEACSTWMRKLDKCDRTVLENKEFIKLCGMNMERNKLSWAEMFSTTLTFCLVQWWAFPNLYGSKIYFFWIWSHWYS